MWQMILWIFDVIGSMVRMALPSRKQVKLMALGLLVALSMPGVLGCVDDHLVEQGTCLADQVELLFHSPENPEVGKLVGDLFREP
jgi:hypothetical protein